MKRPTVNLLIDATAALTMLGMLATGYILRFPLPPGTNKDLTLWGLTRHQWGEIHFWISLGLLGVIGLHLFLHWQWIVSTVGRRLHLAISAGRRHLFSGLLTCASLVAAVALFAWAAQSGVRELTEPRDDTCTPAPKAPVPARAEGKGSPEQPVKVSFARDVYPILERSCLACHGPKKQKGGVRVDRRDDFFGRDGREAFIVPGKSADSPLFAIVSGTRKDIALPDRHRLSEREVAVIRRWIDSGAVWPDVPEKK
jgi:hypothetical protein